MTESPLKIGFNVPFSEAIKAAQQRKVVLPETYYGELQGLARQQAFSISGLASLDQLTIVRDSLAAKLQSGQTFRQWQKDITESGTLDLPRHRLDNIFRTNIQSNYNRGRWERFVEGKDTRPYLMYDAINDSRVRPTHLAMDGIIRTVDDPFWHSHAPLNGYRCRCRLVSLNERLALARSGNGTGLNKGVDTEAMQPDKGFDYNPGEDLMAGINRAISEKEGKLSGLFKTSANEILKAWPGNNIAKRIPVKDISDIKNLLTEYARIYPEHLPYGVKSVLPAEVTDDFFMATDGKGVFKFAEVEHNSFNSRTDLLGGLTAIKDGRPLTEHHEYAIESLWHEILHNRQTGAEALFNLDQRNPIRLLSETLNQYVSRLSYGGFIERLGGKAVHQDWVMANGYGYKKLVRNFRETLKVMAVDESINGSLLNINFHGNLLTVNYLLAEAIAKKSPYDKKTIFKMLSVINEQDKFNALRGKISPI